jgi:hypothetical protein
MSAVRVRFNLGEFEVAVAARWCDAGLATRGTVLKRLAGGLLPLSGERRAVEEAPTVRDFTVSPARRFADAVASAAIVRDVAAFGALVLFGTMLAVVLSSVDLLV